MATIEEMKQEAKLRMIRLNLQPAVLEKFEEGTLYITSALGAVRELSPESDYSELVEKLKKGNKLPYHLLEDIDSVSILFVSNESADWPLEEEYAKQHNYMAYVSEFEYPIFAESGFISIISGPTGIKRVG
ncbi:hypothetical protein [Enterococcus sp. DIV1059_2]|uniref:hypothetical protein n=1 Tax=Enterococcus sp. DIV1059_2 TaxID=2774664 RepID=UPI003F255A8A